MKFLSSAQQITITNDTLDYFLESANRLGYQSVELWASGPHLHLEDFDGGRLRS